MPLRGGPTLSLPPAMLPWVTDSAWFAGPVLIDEDAALSAQEMAYEDYVRATQPHERPHSSRSPSLL